MVTKKRKATAKVKEAAPTYTARSRRSKSASTGEAVWELLNTLPFEEQTAFVEKMLGDPQWLEEIGDLVSIAEARGQPGVPLDDVVAEIERDRKRSK